MIISHTVWLYHVFSLSPPDVELILAEHGVAVTTKASATIVRLGAHSRVAAPTPPAHNRGGCSLAVNGP